MSPLGSTILQDHACGDAAWFVVFIPSITITVDRHKRRVNGVVRVPNGNGANTLKPAVINGYTLPLSSTITDGHSDGDVECPFCFYPDILPFIDHSIDWVWTILDADFLIGFEQNRQTSTQTFYTGVWQDGDHG